MNAQSKIDISFTLNGEAKQAKVEPRLLLTDFLRHELGLSGTHVGCEHGVCGACTVVIDGNQQRSCLVFAIQIDGCEIKTIEGVCGHEGALHPVQQALSDHHGLQCGFCTSGFVMTITAALEKNPDISDDELYDELAGHLCRCTGYRGVIEAARAARDQMREGTQTQ